MSTTKAMSYTSGHLPYEVLLRCIYFAAANSAGGPLPYVFLSQSWAETIFQESDLWTTIFICNGEDESARIQSFLYLSRRRPLDVVVVLPLASTETIESVLAERDRIRSLSAIYDTNKAHKNGLYFTKVIKYFTKGYLQYPQMQVIDTHDESEPSVLEEMIQLCPNLYSVRGTPFPPSAGLATQLHEVEIELEDKEDTLRFVFSTALKRLTLRYDMIELADDDWIDWIELETLISNGGHGGLQYLNISLQYDGALIIPSLISALPQLRFLELQLTPNDKPIPDEEPPIPPIFAENMCHIDGLKIFFMYSHGDQMVERILKMFTQQAALEHLRFFHFESSDTIDQALFISLLNSLSRVEVLTWDTDLSQEVIDPNFQPVILEKLGTLFLRPSYLLDYIHAPALFSVSLLQSSASDGLVAQSHRTRNPLHSARHLSIDPRELDFIAAGRGTGLSCPSLQSIQFNSRYQCELLFHTRSLQTVNFGILSQSDGISDSVIDPFLLDLLRHPDACPYLHTIKSPQYPAWELLFEVLRRRNSTGFDIIRQFTLPGYPVTTLLSRLTLLLKGRFDVYTTRDVDDVIFRRFVDSDQEYTACLWCAGSGYIDCIPEDAEQAGETASPRSGLDISLLCLDAASEVLSPLQTAEKWENTLNPEESLARLQNSPRIKREVCSRHLNPVDITGSTLDEVSF